MLANFIEETCTGGGDVLTLQGAISGHLPASAAYADQEVIYYVVEDANGLNKVAGSGIYDAAANTIVRDDNWAWNGVSYNTNPASNIPLSAGLHKIRVSLTQEILVEIIANSIAPINTALSTKVESTDARLSDAREWSSQTVSQAEAEAGSATTRRAWTAQRVKQAILGWWVGSADKTKLDGIQAGAQVNTVTSVAGKTGTVTLTPADVDAAPAAHTHPYLSDSGDTMNGQLTIEIDGVATPIYSDSQLRLRVNNTNDVSLGFHRVGATACQLRHESNGLVLSGTTRTTAANFYAYGNITAYSDSRLKKNIEHISEALWKVQQLNGYTFERTNEDAAEIGKRHTGVIAQEVQLVLPEAVVAGSDGKLAVAYGNMVGLLIEAVKELSDKNADLSSRITALEAP